MTKIQQDVKENYKGNEKGLLNKKAIEAVFAILHRKSSKSKLKKKPSESLQTPLFLFPSVFLKDLPKSLCI